MAKPGSPHMVMVVDDILKEIRAKSEDHEVPISGLMYEVIGDVVDITGLRRMTWSILKSLRIDDRNVSNLSEPKLVKDILS